VYLGEIGNTKRARWEPLLGMVSQMKELGSKKEEREEETRKREKRPYDLEGTWVVGDIAVIGLLGGGRETTYCDLSNDLNAGGGGEGNAEGSSLLAEEEKKGLHAQGQGKRPCAQAVPPRA